MCQAIILGHEFVTFHNGTFFFTSVQWDSIFASLYKMYSRLAEIEDGTVRTS